MAGCAGASLADAGIALLPEEAAAVRLDIAEQLELHNRAGHLSPGEIEHLEQADAELAALAGAAPSPEAVVAHERQGRLIGRGVVAYRWRCAVVGRRRIASGQRPRAARRSGTHRRGSRRVTATRAGPSDDVPLDSCVLRAGSR